MVLMACTPAYEDVTGGTFSGEKADFEFDEKFAKEIASGCPMSPLMEHIVNRGRVFASRGNVDEASIFSVENRADAMVYLGGEQIFPKMKELIRNATSEVLFVTYFWQTDSDPAQTILEALDELYENRKNAGATTPIVVRMIINRAAIHEDGRLFATGSADALAEAIAQKEFDTNVLDITVAASANDAWHPGAWHSKYVVVDGRHAIITGANTQHQNDYNSDAWNDLGFYVSGLIGQGFVSDFEFDWQKAVDRKVIFQGGLESFAEARNIDPRHCGIPMFLATRQSGCV